MNKIELVDEMRRRTNCSYEEAKVFLDKHDGKLVEAIVDFEKTHKPKTEKKKTNGSFSTFCSKCYHTRVIVESKEFGTIMNFSTIFSVVCLIFAPWLCFAGVVAALLLSYKIKIRKEAGDDVSVKKAFDNVAKAVSKSVNPDKKGDKKEEESEITIE